MTKEYDPQEQLKRAQEQDNWFPKLTPSAAGQFIAMSILFGLLVIGCQVEATYVWKWWSLLLLPLSVLFVVSLINLIVKAFKAAT